MLRSFLLTALRNLKRNQQYAAINIGGLATGIACCLVIFVIVSYETSFDDYHSKASRIYRVNLNQQTPEGQQFNGCNYSPLTEAIRRDVTGLEQVTGVYCLQRYQFSKGNNLFEDKYAFFADPHYFQVFDGTWLSGDKASALAIPNSAVVTDSFAKKFLGGTSRALGSTFVLENKLTLTVSGIVETPPSNTDHPYSILISYSSLARFMPDIFDNWDKVGAGATYVVFKKDTRKDRIDTQLSQIIQKHLSKDIAKKTAFHLMALNDNHDRNYDYTSFTYDFPVPVMVILSIIAGLVAFIACINFVNLATAQSLKRAKEVGVRKTMGSSRFQLVMQYLSEAFVITLLAVITGMILTKFGIDELNRIYGKNYLRFELLVEPLSLVFIAGIALVITLLAGFYPAFVLSAYKPVLALKSQNYKKSPKGLSIRRTLVISQFIGAQLLIIVTMIMTNQVNSFKERPMGYDPKSIVLIPALHGNDNGQYEKLRQELQKVPGLLTYSFGNVGNETGEFYTNVQQKQSGIVSYADTAYIHTFQMRLLAGNNLPYIAGGSNQQVLVNESLIKSIGLASPAAAIGTTYTLKGQLVTIAGVIKDSYTQPMSNRVDPITILNRPEKFTSLALSISKNDVSETLRGIEKAWKKAYPTYLCKYQFMDDSINQSYGEYNIIFSILSLASFLAVFIGCLGLYGLVSFMAIQRTKEIGIRKVFGATVPNVVMIFTKESIVLIVIAFLIAAPLAHFLGIAMLMEFPERVTPGIGTFITGLLVSLLVCMLTVGYRSYRAAIQNPVESLRADD
ncbi:ABC transporter permease [Dyadobacter sp. MSC1_007]|jgi:putative ABC transport system permease protein|uniref:ABC transporter permease n=1 Tax=Dyadobacter sp. MSC1_007 TaxID=2909264 RepID=UPI0020300500|nr:ABC transporter permease [Dyadobacter sp. MSC1_007]